MRDEDSLQLTTERPGSGNREPMTPMSKTDSLERLPATEGSVSALDGYRAAGLEIKAMLAAATKRKPKRHIPQKQQMLAGYRAGYHAGLLMAWCMHSYGEFPQLNAEAIRRVLSQNAPHQATASTKL